MKTPTRLTLLVTLILFRTHFVNAQCTTPVTPTISGTGICASSPLTGTLTTTGVSTLQTGWYANPYGGNAVGTGTSFVAPGTSSVYYVAQLAASSSITQSLAMPAQTSTLSGLSRGYYFTAPVSFVITGVRVPTDASTGNSDIAILKFTNGAPPAFSSVTNSFNTLYLTQNNSSGTGIIPVNIPVYAGDIIGILGDRADVVSYASVAPYTASLGSNTLTLNRMGMQYALSTTAPLNIWSEAASNISRVELYTTLGCFNALTAYTMGPAANPVLNIAGASFSICAGAPLTLTASGASTYSWSTGLTTTTITSSPTTNTSYSIIGTSTANCSSSLAVTASVIPLPLISISGPSATCSGTTITLTANGGGSYSWDNSASTTSISVAPTSNITYSVTGTDAVTSCSAIATKSIFINPNPVVAISSVSNVCLGSSITLTAGGADTYSWSTGATSSVISSTPIVTSVYVLTGTTTATGCMGMDFKTITVHSLPNLSIVAPAATCIGSLINLVGSGADTYTWSTGAMGSFISQLVTASLTYSLYGTSNLSGCTNMTVTQVYALPNPTVSFPVPAPICSGDAVNLTASGADSYTWSTGSTSVSITDTLHTATTFTVKGKSNQTGCSSFATGQVSVNPTPTLTLNSPAPVCAGSSVTLITSGADIYIWSTSATSTSITVNPPFNTIYNVIGTFTSTGCHSMKATTVTIKPLPVIPISGLNEICLGDVLTLSVTGADSYSWNTGATTPILVSTPSSNTSFSVTGTNTLTGCSAKAVHSVVVNAIPSVSVTAGFTTVCASDAPVNLIGIPAGGFYTGLNVNGSLFNPNLNAGIYSVNYSYANPTTACSNTCAVSISVNLCTGLEAQSLNTFHVFPNPGSGEFFMEFTTADSKTIQVIDLSGRILSEQTMDGERSMLDLKSYPNGVYYLKIKSAVSLHTVKVIKN